MGSFQWSGTEVGEALGLESEDPVGAPRFGRIHTDSRTVVPGDLFVALRGETFDGHAFLDQARARGALGAVLSADRAVGPEAEDGFRLYPVPDTLVALGALARHRRRRLPARIVGITGSSGKTTVKDLLAAALATRYRVHATRGNLNNRIGVPHTLLEAPEEVEFVVVEVGTSEPGEIAALAAVCEPDAAIVTVVGEAHLSGLTSLEGVLHEKLELIRGTRPGGPVVTGDRPPELPRWARSVREDVVVAGATADADVSARVELLGAPDQEGRFRVRLGDTELRSPFAGRHAATNLAIGLTMARLLGVPPDTAAEAVAGLKPRAMRGEVRRIGELTLILDCYNANPQSTFAALELLADLPSPGHRRVALLGSMLELGDASSRLHGQVLDRARSMPLDLIVAVGDFAAAAEPPRSGGSEVSGGKDGRYGWAAPSPEVLAASTPEEGYALLRPRLQGSETVLLKASRGVALERLLPRFEADFGEG